MAVTLLLLCWWRWYSSLPRSSMSSSSSFWGSPKTSSEERFNLGPLRTEILIPWREKHNDKGVDPMMMMMIKRRNQQLMFYMGWWWWWFLPVIPGKCFAGYTLKVSEKVSVKTWVLMVIGSLCMHVNDRKNKRKERVGLLPSWEINESKSKTKSSFCAYG